jgi:uncharacterized protein (DUF3820 family)
MKTFTDSTMMPFGKFGPKGSDPRKLGDVPEGYLRWLSQQEFMYHERELGEYIDARLERQAAPAPKVKKPEPPRGPRMKSSLKDFAKTL